MPSILPMTTVDIIITNPTGEQSYNEKVIDGLRRYLAFYPGDRFNEDRAAFAIARARRSPQLANITYDFALGRAGGLAVTFKITLADGARKQEGQGYFVTGNKTDLPVLYDKNGTYVRAKFEAMSLYYGNNNAWYGQPTQCLPATLWYRESLRARATQTGWKASRITASTASRP